MERKNGRNHGEVFTDKNAVQFILDEVGYSSDLNLSSVNILEPASGNGAFATEIIKRLYKSSLSTSAVLNRVVKTLIRFYYEWQQQSVGRSRGGEIFCRF
jgi:predicted helicase